MMNPRPRIMLVDDEINVLRALERQLRTIDRGPEPGYQMEFFTDPAQALKRAQEISFDLVISDYRMPEIDGVTFLTKFREIQPCVARLILSGQTDLPALIAAINVARIMHFLLKPWDQVDLAFAVENALLESGMLMRNKRFADERRLQEGIISHTEAEYRRLEAECPGITQVEWGLDGSVMLEKIYEEMYEETY